MTSRRPVPRPRRPVLVAALCVLFALTSCVAVPTVGPVTKVEGQQLTSFPNITFRGPERLEVTWD